MSRRGVIVTAVVGMLVAAALLVASLGAPLVIVNRPVDTDSATPAPGPVFPTLPPTTTTTSSSTAPRGRPVARRSSRCEGVLRATSSSSRARGLRPSPICSTATRSSIACRRPVRERPSGRSRSGRACSLELLPMGSIASPGSSRPIRGCANSSLRSTPRSWIRLRHPSRRRRLSRLHRSWTRCRARRLPDRLRPARGLA